MMITLIDLVIILLMIIAAVRGWRSGFIRQVGALFGLVVGIELGSWLATRFTASVVDPTSRPILTLTILLLTAFIVSGLAEAAAYELTKIARWLHLHWLDAAAGSLVGLVITLLGVWLLAATVSPLLPKPWRQLLEGSAILTALDRTVPAPAIIARLNTLVHLDTFPKVFVEGEPDLQQPVATPTLSEVSPVAASDQASVVKVEGVGCGVLDVGSGFVVAPDLVVTNAHVVAGVHRLAVQDSQGHWHQATPVLFDPDQDVAIIRTSGLVAAPLTLSDQTVASGSTTAVLGFPGGGSLRIVPARVVQKVNAIGNTIYNSGTVSRQVYELRADVEEGNSGGPLVLPDGRVIGIVFARSAQQSGVGYALALPPLLSEIQQVSSQSAAVSTEQCLAG